MNLEEYKSIWYNKSKSEIEQEILLLNREINDLKNKEQAIKIFINSVYGAIGSEYFIFYNNTDSAYLSFNDIYNSVITELDALDFVERLYQNRIKQYIDECFNQYAIEYKTENRISFKLETICEKALFLAKKKYILMVRWKEGGATYDSLEKFKVTGYESIKTETQSFCRSKLDEIIQLVFKENENSYSKIMSIIDSIKSEFMLRNPEDISINRRVNKYNNYVVNDSDVTKPLLIKMRAQAHLKAAAYHNYLLNKHPELKNKYELLKDGDKIKYYYAKNPDKHNTEPISFGYAADAFPHEIAPKIDYTHQFEKTFLAHVNKILVALKKPIVTTNQLEYYSFF